MSQFSRLVALANQDPIVLQGLDALENDGILKVDSLMKAEKDLSIANNEYALGFVDTDLQSIVNSVRQNRQQLSARQAALYVYTAQALTSNLATCYQFADGHKNAYMPVTTRKYYEILAKSQDLGIDPAAVSEVCFTKEFQFEPNPNDRNYDAQVDPVLARMEVLNEQHVDTLLTQLRHVPTLKRSMKIAKQKEANADASMELAEEDYGTGELGGIDPATIDKINNIVRDRLQVSEKQYDINFIDSNMFEIIDIVGEIVNVQDYNTLRQVIMLMQNRVFERQYYQTEEQGREM